MDKQRRMLAATILIVLLVVAGYYIFRYFSERNLSSGEFNGSLVSVEGNTINLRGNFINNGTTVILEKAILKDFSFDVNEATIFEKIEIKMPAWEPLGPNDYSSRTYSLKDLESVRGPGSLDDLKDLFSAEKNPPAATIFINVNFSESDYSFGNPVADNVLYRVLIEALPQ